MNTITRRDATPITALCAALHSHGYGPRATAHAALYPATPARCRELASAARSRRRPAHGLAAALEEMARAGDALKAADLLPMHSKERGAAFGVWGERSERAKRLALAAAPTPAFDGAPDPADEHADDVDAREAAGGDA